MIFWIASYPRSGNTLTTQIFHQVFKKKCYEKYNNFFNYINNGIDQVTFVDGFQRTRPINFFTNKKIGLSENYNFQKNKVWEGNNGLTIFYIQTNSSLKETLPTIKNATATQAMSICQKPSTNWGWLNFLPISNNTRST
jgi:hypothetical protein